MKMSWKEFEQHVKNTRNAPICRSCTGAVPTRMVLRSTWSEQSRWKLFWERKEREYFARFVCPRDPAHPKRVVRLVKWRPSFWGKTFSDSLLYDR